MENNPLAPQKIEIEKSSPWRIGIQGYPKTGKSWSALTFPKPIILNFDNNIPRFHPNLDNAESVPFFNDEFCAKLKCTADNGIIPRYKALKRWLEKAKSSYGPEYTMIWDSATFTANVFDAYWDKNPIYTKQGEVDSFAPWRAKLNFFVALHDIIKGLSCNFICIIHETEAYDGDGKMIGMKPILTGAFANQIAGHYTEWFRQTIRIDKTTKEVKYVWQVISNKEAKVGGNFSYIVPGGEMLATYQELERIKNEYRGSQVKS